ncbi:undecaprenyl-diphosphate phosphatase [Paraconexibacter antarcticus]|uniref:Undecaprenyl-diphosphatase n=1 Tax=Paraconexibacter antarcticus TaxID=2949664 RepID=A0ABY5DSY4_9ACTN|nr:undecaprenyl-diphosphate phosphatase [Paraconexibacter antarcticus]UTI65136.1 undecaprenyl-diphosphate phosphatase [Paraconexibacter antarcticus]
MISYLQGAILGLLQGIAEPFPISSLGHGVILPRVAGWDIHQNDKFFLSFLVATHLATALVLLGFFWNDWKRIVGGILRSLKQREIRADDPDAQLGWRLVVGTIPVGIIGLLAEKPLRHVFASAPSAAAFLFLNGVMLFAAERLRRRAADARALAAMEATADADARLSKLTWRQSAAIGTAQAIGLIPGFSRSGATMSAGLVAGLDNEDAARFSFLLATPIIGAAALLKIPDLLGPDGDGVRGPALLGAVCAAVTTFFAVKFLLRFFETNRLTPFAYYCMAAGAALTVAFAAGA